MGFRLVVETQMEVQKCSCRGTPGGAWARSPRPRVRYSCVCLVTMVTAGPLCFWNECNLLNRHHEEQKVSDLFGFFFHDNSQPGESGEVTSSPPSHLFRRTLRVTLEGRSSSAFYRRSLALLLLLYFCVSVFCCFLAASVFKHLLSAGCPSGGLDGVV